jgi:hypothetical protein
MADVSTKAKAWIDQKRDPRSAHWQAGLEAVLDLFLPGLQKGRILPVQGMDNTEHGLFKKVLAGVDVNPAVYAAFLPHTVADAIVPPDSAKEVLRIEAGKPSCKLIILRPGNQDRIICAELSDQAFKPGLDIFQSGALLGSYDYGNTDDCLEGLNKAVKAHVWKKSDWKTGDIHDYTLNWFERVRFLNTAEVSVDEALSFFHSPTLIKADRVSGLFQLVFLLLNQEYTALDFLAANPLLSEKIIAKDSDFCRTLARTHILDLVTLVKDLSLMDFTDFNDKENQAFQREFERTEERLRDRLMHLKPR